ncbi:MAG: hypothetical protein ACP5FY_07850 [Kosmotogaceae bacterium]
MRIVIDDEEFGRSSGYEDLTEENSTGNDIEHVSNILDVVQKISGIVHTECDRSEMISKICGYLLETRGYPLKIKGDDILLEGYLQLQTWSKQCLLTGLTDTL